MVGGSNRVTSYLISLSSLDSCPAILIKVVILFDFTDTIVYNTLIIEHFCFFMENGKELSSSPRPSDLDLDRFDEGRPPSENWAKKLGLLVFEVVKVVLISLAIIVPVRLFLVQPFYVEGASMEPNFFDKEYLIINEISYRFEEPQRGEVVIFKSPSDRRVYFIKRIIGLPGEKVEIQSGQVYINGQKLEEDYIANFSADDLAALALGPDEFFVLGDNRNNSHDSRRFGAVPRKDVVGKVWFRGWPLDRLNTFNLPNY